MALMHRLIGVMVLALVLASCGQTDTASTGGDAATGTEATAATDGAVATEAPAAGGEATVAATETEAEATVAATETEAEATTEATATEAEATTTGGDATAEATAGGEASTTATAAGGAGGAAGPVAQAPEGTLLRTIQDRGNIVIGVKYDQPGFGFLNPTTNELEGFDVDLGRAIAERIFGDEDAVEFKEAISRNRIPYLNDGTVDLVIATMTANEERAQEIDFSDTYYVAGRSLLVKSDSDITGIQDLAGKTVATNKGSTSETNIRELAPEANVDLYDTYADGLQAVLSGRADALTTDDIILYGFQNQNEDTTKVVGGQFTQEPYAIGLPKDSPELQEVVNQVIRDLKSNGGWAELYREHVSTEDVPEAPPQEWRDVYENQP